MPHSFFSGAQAVSLRRLLESPAHVVMRVMRVTQANWQLPEKHGRRSRAAASASVLSLTS